MSIPRQPRVPFGGFCGFCYRPMPIIATWGPTSHQPIPACAHCDRWLMKRAAKELADALRETVN